MLEKVLTTFLKWSELISKSKCVTYNSESLTIWESIEDVLAKDKRLKKEFEIVRTTAPIIHKGE